MEAPSIEYPTNWTDYELLDSGDGEKLERFGPPTGGYTLVRPDPRALWAKHAPGDPWNKAHAAYVRTSVTEGHWRTRQPPPTPWRISYQHLAFGLKPTEFKHVGVFPEQAPNWDWLNTLIKGKTPNVLNLFGYTGGATMAAAAAGARVTHVDSAKGTIAWARENAVLSHLTKKPIRWIEDDAYKFAMREGRRGAQYDGIIMDPPRFGRGPQGEVWKIEEDLPKLIAACKMVLSTKPAFILLNAYTADLSSLVLHHALGDMTKDIGGVITFGELALKESNGGRLLPSGIFARWQSE